jgi:outer membrane protein
MKAVVVLCIACCLAWCCILDAREPLKALNPDLQGPRPAQKAPEPRRFSLKEAVSYALDHNPNLMIARREIEAEGYGVDAAVAERMPKIDFLGSATRYRYPMPLTPIVISGPFGAGMDIPDFERTIYDTGVALRIPVFRGGRLVRGVRVAELKKAVAEDRQTLTAQELVYNVSSVFYKILQLEKLLEANDLTVKQLETHKRNVELFLKTGTAPRLDLLKTDVELAHATQRRLSVRNSLESAYELLKVLMGLGEDAPAFSVAATEASPDVVGDPPESIRKAFQQRPEFRALAKKKKMLEEQVKIAQGRRLPDLFVTGDYSERAGPSLGFKDNWAIGLRMAIPVFDGGLISADVARQKTELLKWQEEEKALRLSVTREVKDAHLGFEYALERRAAAGKALESATENLHVESLKYETGAGTTTDVLDAQAALLRAEADYLQAVYDRETAVVLIGKVTGESVNR